MEEIIARNFNDVTCGTFNDCLNAQPYPAAGSAYSTTVTITENHDGLTGRLTMVDVTVNWTSAQGNQSASLSSLVCKKD